MHRKVLDDGKRNLAFSEGVDAATVTVTAKLGKRQRLVSWRSIGRGKGRG